MYSIETTDLHYYYSDKNAIVLDNVNLQVPESSIYGFLGDNGSGKTTTMKLILGMLKNKSGEIRILNQSLEENRTSILRNVGALIEFPVMYGHLSAKENLQVLQKIYQCKSSRIDETLKVVGLHDTGRKKASQFSLGMKQRLGIAIALFHEPSLLILDEPTNGLDVNGILEVREILAELPKRGITVVISSHQLSEIEKMVTHIGIINKGVLRFQGTIDELSGYAEKTFKSEIVLETDDMQRTMEILHLQGVHVSYDKQRLLLQGIKRAEVPVLTSSLVKEGVKIYSIGQRQIDLETIFKQINQN